MYLLNILYFPSWFTYRRWQIAELVCFILNLKKNEIEKFSKFCEMTLFLLFTCSLEYFNVCLYTKIIKIIYSKYTSSFYNNIDICFEIVFE